MDYERFFLTIRSNRKNTKIIKAVNDQRPNINITVALLSVKIKDELAMRIKFDTADATEHRATIESSIQIMTFKKFFT